MKYYTPTIDDLHVGFEYEISDPGGTTFEKRTIISPEELSGMIMYIDDDSRDCDVRAKYIDQEDIEECGFKHIGSGWYEKHYDKFEESINPWFFIRIRKWKDQELDIWGVRDEDDKSLLFRGKIKNKSELKKILKMVL